MTLSEDVRLLLVIRAFVKDSSLINLISDSLYELSASLYITKRFITDLTFKGKTEDRKVSNILLTENFFIEIISHMWRFCREDPKMVFHCKPLLTLLRYGFV